MDIKLQGNPPPADLIRTFAIVLVILLHAAIEPHPLVEQITQAEVWRWWTVNIYDSLARVSVPLFVILSGALLLNPAKKETISVFWRKRLNRIALPFVFWGAAYFTWRYFVNRETLTFNSVFQGILTGPYMQFWFVYMLLGLYLLTPILRVVTYNCERKILRYYLTLWLVGTAVLAVLNFFFGFSVDAELFLLSGWVGYFVMGTYLCEVKVRPVYLVALLLVGYASTAIGTYYITATVGGVSSYLFYDFLGINVIAASVALYLLLSAAPYNRLQTGFPRISRLVQTIGQNTLPLFFFHVMVLESFQKGYFGFRISVNTMNPAIEIPLVTMLTLFVSLGIILLAKKVPILKRFIG